MRPPEIVVKDWKRFQHYKTRNPPWIRLYRDIIDNAEYRVLSDAAGRFLFELWLLASELHPGGRVPCDLPLLAWRTGRASADASGLASIHSALQELDARGFISYPLASEIIASTDASTFASIDPPQRQRQSTEKPPVGPPKGTKRKGQIPDDWKPHEKHRERAVDLHLDCEQEAEAYREHAEANGRKLMSWDAGFFTWLRRANDFRPNGRTKKPESGALDRPLMIGWEPPA